MINISGAYLRSTVGIYYPAVGRGPGRARSFRPALVVPAALVVAKIKTNEGFNFILVWLRFSRGRLGANDHGDTSQNMHDCVCVFYNILLCVCMYFVYKYIHNEQYVLKQQPKIKENRKRISQQPTDFQF